MTAKFKRDGFEDTLVISARIEHRIRKEANCQTAARDSLSEMLCIFDVFDGRDGLLEALRAGKLIEGQGRLGIRLLEACEVRWVYVRPAYYHAKAKNYVYGRIFKRKFLVIEF